MNGSDLCYFRHSIEGRTYVGWYRIVFAHDLEVLGVGMLERIWFRGNDPEPIARSVLEDFVRRQLRSGQFVPAFEDRFDGGKRQLPETWIVPESSAS